GRVVNSSSSPGPVIGRIVSSSRVVSAHSLGGGAPPAPGVMSSGPGGGRVRDCRVTHRLALLSHSRPAAAGRLADTRLTRQPYRMQSVWGRADRGATTSAAADRRGWDTGQVTPDDLAHLRRARDLMDREYARPLDVPTMARQALMSPAHFSRQF